MRPLFRECVRAMVSGLLLGLLASVPLAVLVRYFGAAGLYWGCVVVATGSFAAGGVLERRARHTTNGDATR